MTKHQKKEWIRFVEPSIFDKRQAIIRGRMRKDAGPDEDAIRKQMKEMRSRSIENMKKNLPRLKSSMKKIGINVVEAKDSTNAAQHVSKFLKKNDLPDAVFVNHSSAVREMEKDLAASGVKVLKTYDTEIGRTSPMWTGPEQGAHYPRYTFEFPMPKIEDTYATFKDDPLSPVFYSGPVLPEVARAGLLGVNAAGADGSIFFLQHTSNISRIMNSVEAAVIVVPIDKVVPDHNDAYLQTKCAAGFGAGSIMADLLMEREEDPVVERKEIPEKVYDRRKIPEKIEVLLFDNGRSTIIKGRDRDLLACIGCKACTSVCVRSRLPDTKFYRNPRDLAFSGIRGNVEHSVDMGLFNCTLCGGCEMECPVGIPFPSILLNQRINAAKKGALPEAHKILGSNVLQNGNPFGGEQSRRAEFYSDFVASKQAADSGVLLFMGCLPSYQNMKIVQCTLKILNKIDIVPSLLGEKESCCGFPLYIIGSPDFEKAANRVAKEIKAVDPEVIVTPCSGCHRGLREVFPEAGIDLGAKVVHVTEYLDGLCKRGDLGIRNEAKPVGPVIYHDPCDIGRHFKIFEPPRNILKALPGVQYHEFPRNREKSKCCGGGGGMMAYNTTLSAEMAYERLCEAEYAFKNYESGTVVSACPACVANLSQAQSRYNKEGSVKLRVKEITELLLKSM
jgi:Fe-S oxidoreductase